MMSPARPSLLGHSALRLLWCSLALTVGLFVIVLAWLLRPRDMTVNSDAAISAAIGSLGALIALSALPVVAGSEA
jgi:multisubunit Na+/H+ antiporter MnhB subunit